MAEHKECDVCVVGTGAGGGMLAYKLAKAGLNVISLEQGGRLADDYFRETAPPGGIRDFGITSGTQWPSDPHDSLFIHPLFADGETGSTSRPKDGFRHFQVLAVNGLQNLWNGVSVRFSEQDFSNWPIAYDDLKASYDAVEERIIVCGTKENIPDLPDGIYVPPKPLRPADRLVVDAVNSLKEPHAHAIPNRKAIDTRPGIKGACISTGICTSGCPVGAVYKFTGRLLPEIQGLPNYHLQTNAKVVRLIREKGSARLSGIEYIDTKTGQRHTIKAGIVVLAAGAIETPRILFNSADEHYPNGLANKSGQVGLGLQDNPKSVLSTSLWKLWNKRRDFDIGYGDLLILLARGKLKDGSEFPFIGHAIHAVPDVPHYLGEMQRFPPYIKEPLARMMFHSYVTLGLFCAGEILPENRVRPSRSLDKYGVAQVDVDFQVPPKALQQMDAMTSWGNKVLRRASATIIRKTTDNTGTGIHYAGTTAMSDDPAKGVVDANLRSHEIENLYICDGGVIPHLPDKHLTLTIMALAYRLGDHLSERIKAGIQTAT